MISVHIIEQSGDEGSSPSLPIMKNPKFKLNDRIRLIQDDICRELVGIVLAVFPGDGTDEDDHFYHVWWDDKGNDGFAYYENELEFENSYEDFEEKVEDRL